MPITKDPAALVYALMAVGLAVHMVLLDAYSGVVRAKTRKVINPEDASTVAKNAEIVDGDPPEVARVLRAHRNLLANGVPFLILGLVWILTGATLTWTLALFGIFFAARLAHTMAYVAAKQPWRTASFVVGQLAMLGVVVEIVRNVIG